MAQISWSLALLLVSSALLNCQPAHSQVEAASDHEANNNGEEAPALVEDKKSARKVEDWKPIYDKIYDRNVPPLKPDEMYEQLKLLLAMMELSSEKKDRKILQRTKRLVEARDSDPSKCTLERKRFLDALLSFGKIKRLVNTIVPYMSDAIEKFQKLCMPSFITNLRKSVGEMSPDMLEDIETITNSHKKFNISSFKASGKSYSSIQQHKQILDGSLLVLERRNGDLYTGFWPISPNKFKKNFNEQIGRLCNIWINITEPIADIKRSRLKFNELETKWLFYGRTCKLLKELNEYFIREAYEQLKAEAPRLASEMRDDLETIGKGYLKLKSKGNKVMWEDRLDFEKRYPKIVEGILLVLKKRKNGDLFARDGLVDIDKFEELYKEHIRHLCETWTDPIDDFPSAPIMFDEREAEQLFYDRTCQLLKQHDDFLIREAYEQFKKEARKQDFVRKVVKNLNCFGKDTC